MGNVPSSVKPGAAATLAADASLGSTFAQTALAPSSAMVDASAALRALDFYRTPEQSAALGACQS